MRMGPGRYYAIVLPDGTEYILTRKNGVHVESVQGIGMPPLQNILTPYAVADGSFYQRTRALAHTITFVMTILAGGEDCYRALKSALVAAVSHHRGVLPFQLKYYGLSRVMYTNVLYDAGLEGGNLAGNAWGAEKVAMRFISCDPYWYDALTDEEITLEGMSLLTDIGYVALRAPDGQWSNLGGGVNDIVYDMLFDTDGNLYLCGEFTAMTSLWEPFDGTAVMAPFATAVAGGGTATVSGGACHLNTSAALADAAMLLYNAALTATGAPESIRVRYRAATIANSRCEVFCVTQNAAAPAVGAVGTYNIYIWQMAATGDFRISYTDAALNVWYWNGAAWQAGVIDLAGDIGGTYRVDFENNGLSWYLVVRDEDGNALYTTSAILWALTRDTGNPRWWWCGDPNAGAIQSSHYIYDVRILDAAVPANHVAKWNATEQAFQTLGAGVDDIAYCMTWAPDGTLYVGGDFLNAGGAGAVRVARWNPTTFAWSALGAGCDDVVEGLAFGVDGYLYAAGQFANAGGGAVNYAAYWDGAAWNALAGGLNGDGHGVARGLDGLMYFVGAFTQDNGATVTLNYATRWSGTAWEALGAGFDAAAWAIAVGLDGTIYVGGQFTTADGLAASRVAKWNGVAWSAMGDGVNSNVNATAMTIDPDGVLYMGGAFSASGTYPIPQQWAFWRDPLWIGGDGDAGGFGVSAIRIHSDGTLAIGGGILDELRYPYWATVTNSGDANALPVFTVYGPGQLCQIVNYTTGQRLDFNIDMLAGEILTIDLRQGYKTITSNFRGNVTWAEIGHAMTMFYLAPGANEIAFWVNEGLVLNGGFETAGGGGADVFANWTETAGTGAIANSTPHSGADAAQLTAGATLNTNVYQDIAVTPGVGMHLTFYTRGVTEAGRYQVYNNTAAADIVPIASTGVAGTIYTRVDVPFTVPAGCLSIRVYLWCPGVNATVAYFDDVFLWSDHKMNYVRRYMGIDKAHD